VKESSRQFSSEDNSAQEAANPSQPDIELKDEDEASENEPDAEPEEQPADELDKLFGRPSLNSSAARSPKSGGSTRAEQAEPDEATTVKKPPKNLSLKDVKDIWSAYVESLRQQVPQMLYFQMQRLDPVKLKNGELML